VSLCGFYVGYASLLAAVPVDPSAWAKVERRRTINLLGFLGDLRRNAEALWPLWLVFVLWILVSAALTLHAERQVQSNFTFARAFYLTMITALTIGYGDEAPKTSCGRLLSVMNGLAGLTLFGVWVAVVTDSMRGN
jgi:voltage-gated potassium channel